MEYEKFRGIWHKALAQAGLMSMLPQTPLERFLSAFRETV